MYGWYLQSLFFKYKTYIVMNDKDIAAQKEPMMQLPIIAVFLAIVAGTMDGYVYFTTKTFATFQSGNIILSGYTLATENVEKFVPIILSILFFGLGSMATAIIRNRFNSRNKVWTFTILLFEIILLLILSMNMTHQLFAPLHIAWILSFLAGMQGNAFHKIDNMLYGNIAVTLNVQLAFSYLAETFFKVNTDQRKVVFKKFVDFFVVLIGFSAGAGISAFLVPHIGSYTLVITALGLLGIYIIGRILRKEDPTIPIDSN